MRNKLGIQLLRRMPNAISRKLKGDRSPLGISNESIGQTEPGQNIDKFQFSRDLLIDRRDRVKTRSTARIETEEPGQSQTYRLLAKELMSPLTPVKSDISSLQRAKLDTGTALASLLAPSSLSPRCFCGSFLGLKAAIGVGAQVNQYRKCRRCGREFRLAQI